MAPTRNIKETDARNLSREEFEKEYLQTQTPVVIRNFASEWKIVNAAKSSMEDACRYLIDRDSHVPSYTIVAPPDIEGRFLYNRQLDGPNFRKLDLAATAVIEQLLKQRSAPDNAKLAMSMQAASLASCFPSIADEIYNPYLDDVEPTIWISNESKVAAHFDLSDNIACVALGSRTFRLYPPEQCENLYLGPILNSPGGVPASLVDSVAPDLERFPDFGSADEACMVASLTAGDAIFIPSPWWHAVQSHDAVNVLINYWWNDDADTLVPSANSALMLGMLAFKEMDQIKRQQWSTLFDHFVFNLNNSLAKGLPPNLNDLSTMLTKESRRECIKFLKEELNTLLVDDDQ